MELARASIQARVATPAAGPSSLQHANTPTMIFVNDQSGSRGGPNYAPKLEMLPPRHTATPLLKNHPQRKMLSGNNENAYGSMGDRRGTIDLGLNNTSLAKGVFKQGGNNAGGVRESMSISSMIQPGDKQSMNGRSLDKNPLVIRQQTILPHHTTFDQSESMAYSPRRQQLLVRSQLMAQARANSAAKVHPIHLVQAAAFRAKLRSEEKLDRISRLELQKETLRHIQERQAQEIFCVDAPKTRAQEEKERVAFMKNSNIKNNLIAQFEGANANLSLQPHKFNTTGWTYKQLGEVKLRSNFMDDHINGRYCNRSMHSKRDDDAYKPGKIFTSMYQKAYQSRNYGDDKFPTDENLAEVGKLMSKTMGIKNVKRPNMFEVLGKTSKAPSTAALMAAEAEAVEKKGKNSYSPDFVSSLNFNFNTNDAFGTRIKKSAAHSMLKSHNSVPRQDQNSHMLTMDAGRNGTTGSSFVNLNSLLRESRDQLRTHVAPHSTTSTDEEQRREMNSQVLKNQYSFWAGMYVKRMVPANPDSKTQTIDDLKGNVVVPFGDPRSVTQCIDFNRKKPPHLPEQEMKSGGGVRPLGIPQRFEKSKKPPSSHKSSKRGKHY